VAAKKGGARGGRKPGSTNASAEDIRKSLAAWIALGSSAKAAAHCQVSDATIRGWKVKHPDVWNELDQVYADARRGATRRAAHDSAESLPKAVIVLDAMVMSPKLEPKDRIRAAEALARIAEATHRATQLDDGKPTGILDDRRTDRQLVDEIERDSRDLGMPIDTSGLRVQ